MFGRKQSPAPEAESTPIADDHDPRAPKGRPTPSRKDAEAARKQQLKIPKDPKAAKAAARERDREARAAARAGMMAGDERYMPARDKGPARAFTRDFGTDRMKPGAVVQVPIALSGGTAQSNATSFEDTTNFVGTCFFAPL